MDKKKVADIMAKRVICLHEEDNLEDIARGMERYNLRHLPVVSDDKLVGLISHRDLLRLAVSSLKLETLAGQKRQKNIEENTFVVQVMTKNPQTVRPDTSIKEALEILLESKFGCLPVTDEDGMLVGIVTEVDFLKLLMENLG